MKKTLSLIIAIVLVVMMFSVNVVAGTGYSNGATVWTDNNVIAKYYSNDDIARNNGMVAKAEIPVGEKYVTAYFGSMEDVMAAGETCGANYFEVIVDTLSYTENVTWSSGKRSFTVDGNGCVINNTGTNKYFEFVGEDGTTEFPDGQNYTGLRFKDFEITGKGSTYQLVQIGESNDSNKRPVAVTFEDTVIKAQDNDSFSRGLIVVFSNSKMVMDSGSSIVYNCQSVSKDDSCRGIYAASEGAQIEINSGARIDISGCPVNIMAPDVKLTVNGGTIISKNAAAICASNGNVIINSGTLGVSNENRTAAGVIVADENASVTVNGGNFYDDKGSSDWIFNNLSLSNANFVLNAATTWGNNNVFSGNGNGGVKTGVMLEGASVRTAPDKTSGIRFQSTIDKNDVDTVKGIDATAVIGTLIAPYDYVEEANGVFTKNALSAIGKTYLDIPAKNGMNEKDTYYVINAAMVNVKEENYTKDLAAVPYISYKTSDSMTVTAYGVFDSEKNVRNIKEVAYCALSDVLIDGRVIDDGGTQVTVDEEYAKSKGYVTAVYDWYEYDRVNGVATHMQGKAYSEYSNEQLSVIKGYIKEVQS